MKQLHRMRQEQSVNNREEWERDMKNIALDRYSPLCTCGRNLLREMSKAIISKHYQQLTEEIEKGSNLAMSVEVENA